MFLQGYLKLGDSLIIDEQLGIECKTPILIREIEMFQWAEERL